MTVTDRLERVAAQQHGLVTVADARELGIGDSALRKLQGKTLRRLTRGVYQVTSVELTHETVLLAAVLDAGRRYSRDGVTPASEGPVASGQSALALHGLADHPVHPMITVPPGHRFYDGVPASYRAVTEQLTPSDICEVRGIQSVTAEKALAEIAPFLRDRRQPDWTCALADIEAKVNEIADKNPSPAQDRLAHAIGLVRVLAVAWRRAEAGHLTDTVEHAAAVVARWQQEDRRAASSTD